MESSFGAQGRLQPGSERGVKANRAGQRVGFAAAHGGSKLDGPARPIPVRLDLVRSDLYRMARDGELKHYLRIAAARVLLQYPNVGMGDGAATD